MTSDVNYFLLKTCCYTSAFSFHPVNLFEMLISKSKLVLGGHNFSQGAQQSMTKLQHGLHSMIMFMNGNGGKVTPIKLPEGIPGQILHTVTTTPIWSFKRELEAWRHNSSWMDENPTIQVHTLLCAYIGVW
jgi:hypothetical protein